MNRGTYKPSDREKVKPKKILIKVKENKSSKSLNSEMIIKRDRLTSFLQTFYDEISQTTERSRQFNLTRSTGKLINLLRQTKKLQEMITCATNAPTVKYVDSEGELIYEKFMSNGDFTSLICWNCPFLGT